LIFTLSSVGLLANTLANATRGAVIVASLVVLGYWLRVRRLGVWTKTPLMFEDEFPDQPLQLQL
jgi:hypothetical protein